MNSKRMYFVLLTLIGLLLIGLVGGAYGVNQLLHAKAKKLVDLKTQGQILDQQETGLRNAKKQVSTYTPLNNIAKTVVPEDKDQAEAVREISNLAADSGITRLTSITFPQSTLGGLTGASVPSSASTSASSSSTNAKSNLTQLTAVKGATGLYQLQITINQASDDAVPYSEFLTFLSKLEQNRRTAQVIGLNLQPDNKFPNLVGFTLTLNEFIRP